MNQHRNLWTVYAVVVMVLIILGFLVWIFAQPAKGHYSWF